MNDIRGKGPRPLDRLENQLDKLYSNRFSERERQVKAALWRTLCQSFFQKYVPSHATVVDIGAGYGEFINNIEAGKKIAIDLNPELSQYTNPDVEVHNIRFSELVDVLGEDSADVAFASNVFEHLRGPESLLEVLSVIRRTLRPGGILIVMQPNVRLVGGRFWDFVDHTLPLTERGMIEALHLSGFQIAECRPRFLPHTTKSRIPKSTFLLRAYLAIRPAQWILGKQMLVVARKPEAAAA